ncbi:MULTISPECIES: glycoside hydrolase family 3 C-terminal domain-containing protein [unclassified Leifsonia]|uniref:glycoside hydrolase family 3 C-terminal domain-containing protein n=1 Tax=unclassified Leifsonia TaxID=2663824 RepID=UPI0008A7BB4D|nr:MULTISPECIES: glycoside hydrolase family 3 C-terminal domain-containing protein [unclassified Leifsonia]SEI14620.1 beta-glucosidase [Leifsonia sp. CL154]SFM02253.1 beta-glucosidase [Leifsonia sp. CL147]
MEVTTEYVEGSWRNPALRAKQRAEDLLAVLSREEKVSAACGDLSGLARYGVPVLMSKDGPNGLSLPGTTAFPSGYSLASTFNPELAHEFGEAIGAELRGKARAVWLGPAVDITRSPYAGRQTESFGEDPVLAGSMGRAAVLGAKATHTIQSVKHFVVNNQESERIGYRDGAGGRTAAIDVHVDDRALREIYVAPFVELTRDGGADSVMASYNRFNGTPACENKPLIDIIKSSWDGVVTPDFMWAVRDQVAATVAGIDIPQFDQGNGGRTPAVFDDNHVTDERLDDSVRRILTMVFNSGLFDHPLPADAAEVVTSDAHRGLATRIASEGMVLLKNDGVLPISPSRSPRIALIGPNGTDAVYTVGGSAAVDVPATALSTPAAAIARRIGSASLTLRQGTTGDRMSTNKIPLAQTAVDASAPGWAAEYWATLEPAGPPVMQRIEPDLFADGRPDGIADDFSARWTTTITPSESGTHYFTLPLSGRVRVTIDGVEVAHDGREEVVFLAGPELPIIASHELIAGVPVSVVIEYSTDAAGFHTPSIALGWVRPSDSLIAAAARAAAEADIAVVTVNVVASEGMDRTSLALPLDQDRLIDAVAAANRNTVVVVNAGGAILMPWLDRVAAVVVAWYPGEMFGEAIADVLFGAVTSLGRLPVTFPLTEAHGLVAVRAPEEAVGRLVYSESGDVGYRWYERSRTQPQFDFGHGLEYTTFDYDDVQITSAADGGARVELTIRNTGDRVGTAAPQVYAGPAADAPHSEPYVLVGFDRVTLDPGQERRVQIQVRGDRLRRWTDKGWSRPDNARHYRVGESHTDTRLTAELRQEGVTAG